MSEKIGINIFVGNETSIHEINVIKNIFNQYFNCNINNSIVRLADTDLPLLVTFTISAVASGLIYDSLKKCIIRLFKKSGFDINRKIEFQLQYKREKIHITSNKISITKDSKEFKFKSVEELFNELKNK